MTPSMGISGCNNVKGGGHTSTSQHNPQLMGFFVVVERRRCWRVGRGKVFGWMCVAGEV